MPVPRFIDNPFRSRTSVLIVGLWLLYSHKKDPSQSTTAIRVNFDDPAKRHSAIELIVDEHAIQKRQFDTSDTELKFELKPP